MELSLTSDQEAILGALDGLARPFSSAPISSHGFDLVSADLDKALVEGGFLDVAYDPDLGLTTAAIVIERLAALPFAAEVATSALLRPLFDAELSHPVCLVEEGQLSRPIRFLRPGASVVVLGADSVRTFTAEEGQVRVPAESLFAYPVGFLSEIPASAAVHDVAPDLVRARWRLALAAEAAGLLKAAIDATVLYVSERKQFGRPIAVFQAIRHRLAEAHVRANGVRWLALKAASSDDAADAALAAFQAQEVATLVVYDLHQFLGAMGMTLEHPLHLWTYRLKALVSELGGRSGQAADAAQLIWGKTAA